jgi:DNA modification methylase
MNKLYYGDNLPILREYIDDDSVDLIYLDPPFNSNRSYNVLFKDESGKDAEAQITAFEDTWHWGEDAEGTYRDLIQNAPPDVSNMISAMRQFIGANQMMAYLTMMTARLIELHRVLKQTGSIYLHCDPTASHYLKVVMDTIFSADNFQNEVIWKRSGAHGGAKRWGPIHDVLLFYSKGENFRWNKTFEEYDQTYLDDFYRFSDEKGRYRLVTLTGAGTRAGDSGKPWRGVNPTSAGRHWAIPLAALKEVAGESDTTKLTTQEKLDLLDKAGVIYWPPKGSVPQQKRYIKATDGVPVQDVITDILPISSQAQERLGYPTQKPLALLERIIQASSNEGDVLLDPFCGCGTAVVAAEKLKRQWIGIDVTHLSISLMKYRLKDSFGLVEKKDYIVVGEPESIGGARQLASDDRYQFQWWALSLVQAKPLGGESGAREGKKGSDKGIDGVISFLDEKDKTQRILIQVKSGHVSSRDIRDLRGVVERENAAIGAFITLEEPSRDMVTEAVSSGYFHSPVWQKDYPRIQILTVDELLNGKQIEMPPSKSRLTFKQAKRESKKDATQEELF